MFFDLFPPPIISGLFEPSSLNNSRRIIESTIEWSDYLVEHKFASYHQKFVSCIKLIHPRRLERQLYVMENGKVVMIASDRITDNIESLPLPDEHMAILHRQGYFIAKVYGD